MELRGPSQDFGPTSPPGHIERRKSSSALLQTSELDDFELGQGPLQPLADTEARMLRMALNEAKGNLSLAARLLSISRPTLAYRLKKYNIT